MPVEFRMETYYGRHKTDSLELTRVDLIGGGYRTGINGEALFPVKDLQGSIRGYVNKKGLKSAFGYRPYGTTVAFSRYSSDGDERWQGKEFDGEHGKYYFGARYYDPFFGMWISPDPAGQFANPYSYGGDPLNYIDPTGMWALGLGLVVGYDESHGWSFGVGVAAEFGKFGINAAYSFNQDGSKSLSLSANASIPVFNTGLWINGGMGFNMNSYTGASFSRNAGVCYGASSEACAGVELGQGFAWDRSGGFNGMTVYAEAYATFSGVRVSTGYEHGFFGAEGRGLYAGIGGFGLHGQIAHMEKGADAETSWGWSHSVNIGGYNSEKGWYFSNTAKTVAGLFALDMNQSILAMSWQLVSRFTWELPQTALGFGLGILASEFGIVDNVDYERGATILRYNVDIGGAFTIGSFIAGNNLYKTRGEMPYGVSGRPLLKHEYGHTLQSRLFGPLYLLGIAIPSAINAALFPNEHMKFFIEDDATKRSKNYGF